MTSCPNRIQPILSITSLSWRESIQPASTVVSVGVSWDSAGLWGCVGLQGWPWTELGLSWEWSGTELASSQEWDVGSGWLRLVLVRTGQLWTGFVLACPVMGFSLCTASWYLWSGTYKGQTSEPVTGSKLFTVTFTHWPSPLSLQLFVAPSDQKTKWITLFSRCNAQPQ